MKAFQKITRRLNLFESPAGLLRLAWARLRGVSIGKRTRLPPRTQWTWPHQVKLGSDCILQSDIFFNYDHFWTPGISIIVGDRVFIGRGCEFNIRKKMVLGDDCLIASGVKMIDHDHGTNPGSCMREQVGAEAEIIIGEDVWIGVNAVILKGVSIGDHAVVGAGAVVTKSIPEWEIWGGVPAKRIGIRNKVSNTG